MYDTTVYNNCKRKRASIKDWINSEDPVKPSDYFNTKLNPNDQAILVSRVSTEQQSLEDQTNLLTRQANLIGCKVIKVLEHKGSGRTPAEYFQELEEILEKYPKVKIVFETVDRAVRPVNYHPISNPNAHYTKEDLETVKRLASNHTLVTLIDPDLPPREQHFEKIKRGKDAKKAWVGRPKKDKTVNKKNRKYKELVLRLSSEGMSAKKIVMHIQKNHKKRFSLNTIKKWLKEKSQE